MSCKHLPWEVVHGSTPLNMRAEQIGMLAIGLYVNYKNSTYSYCSKSGMLYRKNNENYTPRDGG